VRIRQLELTGAAVVDCIPVEDERGLFARLFCDRELEGLLGERKIRSINLGRSHREGTLRGLHYQTGEAAEMKFVRCTAGSVFDVIVDMRPDSPTYLQWHGEVLSSSNLRMVVVPEYFAHGYQALEDGAEVVYAVTSSYAPATEVGVRWDDPAVRIDWPRSVSVISEKDRDLPSITAPLVSPP
jgi:dTDP-4-dehydrorhamnose 3,5-epimerase